MQFEVNSWKIYKRGFRWTLGTPRRFVELSRKLNAAIERALSLFLFDDLEKSMGGAASVFRLYRVLDLPDDAHRVTWRGLYFYEINDQRSFRLEGRLAIINRVFENFEDFEEEVNGLRGWHVNQRLSSLKIGTQVGSASEFDSRKALQDMLSALHHKRGSSGVIKFIKHSFEEFESTQSTQRITL